MKNAEAASILKFWRDVEIFNIPIAPSKRDNSSTVEVRTLRPVQQLPWHDLKHKSGLIHTWIHKIFIGVSSNENLAKAILQATLPGKEITQRDLGRIRGRGWLAAFAVDENGILLPDSYTPASFTYGIKRLKNQESLDNLDIELRKAKDEFAERRHHVAPETENGESQPQPLNWVELEDELKLSSTLLGDRTSDLRFDYVVKSIRIKRKKSEQEKDADVEFLNSFYLQDLDQLISQSLSGDKFGTGLSTYIGPEIAFAKRTDILEDTSAMDKCIDPARMTASRWPAPTKHSLMLAQQAAVYETFAKLGEGKGLIGINGPPGTGKTTLLCDVIAEIIVLRATKIATLLEKPHELFEPDLITIGKKSVYPLRKDIVSHSSIVVTSNNNAAVENITKVLPAREKVSDEFGAVSYFDDIATAILKKQGVKDDEGNPIEGWGIISAALGNAKNRSNFSWMFFQKDKKKSTIETSWDDNIPPEELEDPEEEIPEIQPNADQTASIQEEANLTNTIKQILEACTDYSEKKRWVGEWGATKQEFLAKLKKFEKIRSVLAACRKSLNVLPDIRKELEYVAAEAEHKRQRSQVLKSDYDSIQRELSIQEAKMHAGRESLRKEEDTRPPRWIDRKLLDLFGYATKRIVDYRERIRTARAPYKKEADKFDAIGKRAGELHTQLKEITRRVSELDDRCRQLGQTVTKHESRINNARKNGVLLPDENFWAAHAQDRHKSSPWSSKTINKLRSEIFLQAVRLHEFTLRACPKQFLANLRKANEMISGTLREPLSVEERAILWDSFFFAVPVISTSLASFSRLFGGMGQESIGWLLVDESGQATPQSVAGAIWRSRRAVIIGDPIQIEPVMTVPESLVKALQERHNVESKWSPVDESAQTLADRTTPLGSWVGKQGDGGIWTGMPLRAHIRCDNPMFDLANHIAYAGQMVKVKNTQTPFRSILGESAWFDVQPGGASDPVIKEELHTLKTMLAKIMDDWPVVLPDNKVEREKPAKVYVISPFKKVAEACREVVKGLGLNEKIECGTVHTFQGKEADIVFMVLGSVPEDGGIRARKWASDFPNLLNVALTRAKCRVYVIGNLSDWKKCNHFHEMSKILPNITISTHSYSRIQAVTQLHKL